MSRWGMVEHLRRIRREKAQHEVRCALQQGAQPLRVYRQGTELVLQVQRPAHWPGAHDLPLTCTIPADKQAATLAWLHARTQRAA
jgi:hypothetical protein